MEKSTIAGAFSIRLNGELCRVVVTAHTYLALVRSQIVGGVRSGLAEYRVDKIMHAQFDGCFLFLPLLSGILEIDRGPDPARLPGSCARSGKSIPVQSINRKSCVGRQDIELRTTIRNAYTAG